MENEIIIVAVSTAKQFGINERKFLDALNRNLTEKQKNTSVPFTYTLSFLEKFHNDPEFSLGLKEPAVISPSTSKGNLSNGGVHQISLSVSGSLDNEAEWKSQVRKDKEKLSVDEKNIRELRSNLNKIVPDNEKKLAPEILNLMTHNCFSKALPLFFDKALQDVKYRGIIINLCVALQNKFGNQFLEAMAKQCILEFEKKPVDDDDENVNKYVHRKSSLIYLFSELHSSKIIGVDVILMCAEKIPRICATQEVNISGSNDSIMSYNQYDITHMMEMINEVVIGSVLTKEFDSQIRKQFNVYFEYLLHLQKLEVAKGRTKFLVDATIERARTFKFLVVDKSAIFVNL